MSTLPFAELLGGPAGRRAVPGRAPGRFSRRMAVVVPSLDDEGPAGMDRWPTDLALALARLANPWAVDVISFGDPSDRELGDGVCIQLLAPHRSGAGQSGSPDSFSWDLPRALDAADAVLVIQPFSRSGEVACLVARALGKPTIAIDHGGHSDTVGLSLGLSQLVDRVVVHSAYGASLVPPPVTPEVVPGGVDHHFFSPPPGPRGRTHFLYVGSLAPHSGIDRLIQHLPGGSRLVLCGEVGEGAHPEDLGPPASGTDVRFETATDREAMRGLYRGARATLVPPVTAHSGDPVSGQAQSMAMNVLASMACGTPALVPNVWGLAELVQEGESGFVCDSWEQLEARMALLAGDPALVEDMGRRARRRVLDHFTMDRVAERFSSIIAGLPGSTGPGLP